jgi:hypothetical protein
MIYVEGYKYNDELEKKIAENKNRSIYDNKYQNYSRAFNYAMDMTEKEIH